MNAFACVHRNKIKAVTGFAPGELVGGIEHDKELFAVSSIGCAHFCKAGAPFVNGVGNALTVLVCFFLVMVEVKLFLDKKYCVFNDVVSIIAVACQT